MRRTHKVARKVQALLQGEFGCVGAFVFNPTYEYVVNGVIIDGTAYKDTVIAYRLQCVFFQAQHSLRLSYSDRVYNLADPPSVTFFEGHVDELAAQIAMTLTASGAAADMLLPYTLRHFLDQHWPHGVPFADERAQLFDVSCAAFLVGDIEQAKAGFAADRRFWDLYIKQYGEKQDQHWQDRYRECCEIAALLDGPDAVLRQHIIDTVTRNAAVLGFQAIGTGP